MEPVIANLLDEHRHASALLFSKNLGPDSAVLDLGCGYGGIAKRLAPFVRDVVAMDLTREKIRFVRNSATAAKIDNLVACIGGNTPYFPFPPNSFDIVIINGVLEWVGCSMTDLNPREAQRRFLVEVSRILRPGGEVFLAIENRYSWIDLLGFPEGHVGIPFAGVLPRAVGNVLHLIRKGEPLRVYTHSRSGYKKLLADANFAKTEFLLPLPSYSNIRTLAADQRGIAVDEPDFLTR